MREGLVFAYGALTEHLDEDQRADVNAILNGDPLPSELKKIEERDAARRAFALAGEIG